MSYSLPTTPFYYHPVPQAQAGTPLPAAIPQTTSPFVASRPQVGTTSTEDLYVVHPALAKPVSTELTSQEVVKRIVKHGAAALGFFASVRLLHRFPGKSSELSNTLLSPDPKEWIKVGLGIAGMSQVNQAFDWKPPVWLNAMMNVMVISPLVAGFRKPQFIQGALLAPVVGALAEATHRLTEASQEPLSEKYHIPPLATHILYSIAMVAVGLRIFPWINQSIPRLASQKVAGAESTALTSCVNGCCSSLICVNDIGQLGAALFKAGSGGSAAAGMMALTPSVNRKEKAF